MNRSAHLNEEDIIEDLASHGWVGEYEEYYLSEAALDELLATANLQQHPRRTDFCDAMNRVAGEFCLGLQRYDELKHASANLAVGSPQNTKKLTTQLTNKANQISDCAEKLLKLIEPLSDQEIRWIFDGAFQNEDADVIEGFRQWLTYTWAFHRRASDSAFDVTRSTPALVRPFVRKCIGILEHFTEAPVTRTLDPTTGKESAMINDFIITLFHHMPDTILAKLPQRPVSFDRVIREAIEEYNALNNIK